MIQVTISEYCHEGVGNKTEQVNLKNCAPPVNIFDLEVGKKSDQGHRMVPIERICHKNHAFQISMLYHNYFRRYEPGWTDRQTDEWVLMSPACEKGRGQQDHSNVSMVPVKMSDTLIRSTKYAVQPDPFIGDLCAKFDPRYRWWFGLCCVHKLTFIFAYWQIWDLTLQINRVLIILSASSLTGQPHFDEDSNNGYCYGHNGGDGFDSHLPFNIGKFYSLVTCA